MIVTLNSDAQKFVEAQVEAGHFRSADDVLSEAINRMMAEATVELDDDTVAAVNRAEAQLDRGEGISFEQFAAEWRQKLAAR